MIRVSQKELIRVLQGALRASELTVEILVSQRENARYTAEARAWELLGEQRGRHGSTAVAAYDALVGSLPLTDDGDLHEPAFLALLEAQVWAQRENELAALTTIDNTRSA